MNRNYKFRAWHKKLKEMLDWEELIGYSNDQFKIIETVDFFSDPELEIMQWTESKDKVGKEIYGGDIVIILYTDWPSQHLSTKPQHKEMSLDEYKIDISKKGIVEFYKDRWLLNFGKGRFGDEDRSGMEPGVHGQRLVIGNIYENPELMEVSS